MLYRSMISMRIGIVGCGINGAYLAWRLSKGNAVEVFEKKSVVGEKPCSELVSERIWNFIPKRSDLVVNEIEGLVIHFPKKDVKMKFDPKMIVIDRKQLANYVVELAKRNGAKISLNSEVKRVFYMKGKKPQLSVSGKVIEFDYLIGSDGYNSIVRKSIGIKDPLFILGIYTRIKKKTKNKVIDVYPLKNGISWVIPRKNEIEYGVYERADTAKDEFNTFCRRMKIRPKEIYAQLIPSRLTKMQKKRIALSGDAIGLTKPWSYGGIIWGLIADDILVKDFPNLTKYENDVRDYFEPKIFYSKIALFAGRFLGSKLSFMTPGEMWFDGDFVYS
jgi:flavin-dependent dehydrogenase